MASPFQECLEALNAIPLTFPEGKELSKLYESLYPLTKWGKIDWDKIDKKIFVGNDNPEDIIPALEKLINNHLDKNVYIDWDSGSNPILKTNLDKVIENFVDVRCASFDKFIFNPTVGYIIEVRFSRDITVGVVPVPQKT